MPPPGAAAPGPAEGVAKTSGWFTDGSVLRRLILCFRFFSIVACKQDEEERHPVSQKRLDASMTTLDAMSSFMWSKSSHNFNLVTLAYLLFRGHNI